ncbi:MAG TPA: hypothetical protein VKR21_05450 [Solirubrobacteraceae bacterium]|nr:hypothetical protein [Solirubrobacteraceae bacterium]
MHLRASRLRWPEWLIGAGGVVLLGAMLLLPWYQQTLVSGPGGPSYFAAQKVDGWNGLAHARWLVLAAVVLALAAAFFQAERRAPAVPVALCLLASVLGAVASVWLIVRVLISPPGGREIGGWIGLLASAVIAYAGFASLRLEGIAQVDGPAEIPTVSPAAQGSS